MNQIPYERRCMTYTNALVRFGDLNQCVVALEELSECQKEICKFLRGIGDYKHLAEEIADATICLEQMRLMFGINDLVCDQIDYKITRLDDMLKQEALNEKVELEKDS